MKVFVFAITAVVLLAEVKGHPPGGRGWGEGGGRGGFHPLPPHHSKNIFPACNDFFYAIDRQLHENEQSDRHRCDWHDYQQQCFFEKLVKARMDLQDVQPSASCVTQMGDFMNGAFSTTSPPTPTTPQGISA